MSLFWYLASHYKAILKKFNALKLLRGCTEAVPEVPLLRWNDPLSLYSLSVTSIKTSFREECRQIYPFIIHEDVHN